MELNNNRHNIFSSTIAPNPQSVKYWADLSANPNGGVIKFWDGNQWKDISNSSNSINELNTIKNELNKKANTEDVVSSLNTIGAAVSNINNYDDSDIRKSLSAITLELNALKERVAALETPII